MISLHTFLDVLCNISIVQGVLGAVLILCVFYYSFWQYHGVPPGPWGIPLLGYWPFLKSENGHLQIQELREKYGEIFSFTVTGNLFISLNSLKLIKEAHVSKSEYFGERFTGCSLMTLSFEESLFMANGESWKIQRKFFQQKFREYGVLAAKQNFSDSICDTLKGTVEEIRAMNGEPFEIVELLTAKCASVIRRILFNDQGITEEELIELNREHLPVLSSMTQRNIVLIGNIARYMIFPFMPCYWSIKRGKENNEKLLTNIINRHKENFDERQVLDIIDCFYKEKKDREKKGDPTSRHFTDKALLSSIYQFVTDGILTIALLITMILQKLVECPEEQEKIYEELLDVLGPDRQPTMDDKSNLPYTNAFFYEVIRFGDSLCMFPSLKCTRETSLRGYRIPKGAITVMNFWCTHRDPNVYEEPHVFNPSRFITVPGKPKPELPVMFGVGKRACMGEALAMNETFLFVATVVKNFHLKIPDGANVSDLLAAGGMEICAHPRDQQKGTPH